MIIAEQNQKLLELLGDRRMTVRQLADEGACIIVNGMEKNLRDRLEKMVTSGVLRKVKIKQSRKPLGGFQFGPRSSHHGYERVKEKV